MTNYQQQWADGYRDGWRAQSTMTPPEPTIPPVPAIPSGVLDPAQWAYDEGKKRGELDRMKVQAGMG